MHHPSNTEKEEPTIPEEVEEGLAVGTITLQNVVIRNLTDIDLEFWMRLNEKLEELAVSKVR